MMVSPVRSIIEVGFATVVGMLIDTFIIRSLMVGSIATLVGELNWWPGRRLQRKK
jgi:RND superfamily putative drug exporter